MNTSASSIWLSNLGMDEYNLFPEECQLKLLDVDDEKFLSHDDIASVFQEQTLTISECTSSTLSNSFSDETSFNFFERPKKLLKTIDFTEKFSPSTISSSHSQILSFDNPNSSPTKTTPFYQGFDPKQNEIVLPKMGNSRLSTESPKGSSKNQNLETKTSKGTRRSPAHAQDHIIAERKRREKLNQGFIALAALVPSLKKMDKASVLEDAVKYVKELKERLGVLEEESKKTKPELICSDEDSSTTCDESIEGANSVTVNESVFQVEARVSEQEIMIRIQCQKYKGLLVKMMSEIQSLHLFVVNSSVLPFGSSILDITIIAQMGEGYSLTIEELVKKLRTATLKFMS